MKKTTYECDLCGRTLDLEDLKGISWPGGGPGPCAERMVAVHPDQASTHLCKACIKDITRPKKVSRQREWQRQQHAAGRCVVCAVPSKTYRCPKHAELHRKQMKALYAKKRLANAKASG